MKRSQLTNVIGDIDIKRLEGAKEESFEAGVVLALSLQGVVFSSHNDVLHDLQVLNELLPVEGMQKYNTSHPYLSVSSIFNTFGRLVLPEELLTRCKMLGVREARLDLSRGRTKEVRHQAGNHLMIKK